jgi:hypothetical protein
LTATPDAIAKLRELCRQGDEELRAAEPELASSHQGDPVEAKLLGLIAEVGVEASRSLRLAREAVVPGDLVEARTIAVTDAYRLSKSMAMLTEALSRHRGKFETKVTVQHFRGDQIGVVNNS